MLKNIDALHNGDRDGLFYQPVLNHIEKNLPVDEEMISLFAQHCKLVRFDKGERLLNVGKVCKYIYFIVSGECMSYYTDANGKTTTWFFHFNRPESTVKNLFAVDYKSFILSDPATISIEALSTVTAIRFSVNDVKALREGARGIEQWVNWVNEQAYVLTSGKVATLLTLSAQQRYEKLLETEPHLLNMFSNYLVASYLNLAPQSLSRIRKRIVCGTL
ncbi:CRP-like cAMP-binding protein [Mucilaginibacter sp. SG538B]|uniref:Crp/Fnr family transcriptional regulator n=1 Tax=Mucilaginibacter sp. SG538B TaxID=2587021 RepID=UPI00159CF55F|nr:Crp/Fnr family transcriptional regulator [Mucilaginibacter sp. SG538B]NVM66749.1 CRP-like cAMP-binding protein [Mucilaginibacter sp. SG538B]